MERFCHAWAVECADMVQGRGTAAMELAEYAPTTVRRGPGFLLKNPMIQARIAELEKERIGEIPEIIEGSLLRVPGLANKVIQKLEDIIDGKPMIIGAKKVYPSPATQLRACQSVLQMITAIMVATIPKGDEGGAKSIADLIRKHGLKKGFLRATTP
jgi:hypothetical protein